MSVFKFAFVLILLSSFTVFSMGKKSRENRFKDSRSLSRKRSRSQDEAARKRIIRMANNAAKVARSRKKKRVFTTFEYSKSRENVDLSVIRKCVYKAPYKTHLILFLSGLGLLPRYSVHKTVGNNPFRNLSHRVRRFDTIVAPAVIHLVCFKN